MDNTSVSIKGLISKKRDIAVNAGQDDTIGQIPIENIITKLQPRTKFTNIDELAESIKEFGLITPISVTASAEQPGKYELITGERRLRACKQLNLPTIKAVILDVSVAESDNKTAYQLVENLCREDLSIAERILTTKALISEGVDTKLLSRILDTNRLYAQDIKYLAENDIPKCVNDLIENNIVDVPRTLRLLVECYKLDPESVRKLTRKAKNRGGLILREAQNLAKKLDPEKNEKNESSSSETTQPKAGNVSTRGRKSKVHHMLRVASVLSASHITSFSDIAKTAGVKQDKADEFIAMLQDFGVAYERNEDGGIKVTDWGVFSESGLAKFMQAEQKV